MTLHHWSTGSHMESGHRNTWLSLMSVTLGGNNKLFCSKKPNGYNNLPRCFCKILWQGKKRWKYMLNSCLTHLLFLSLGWSSYIRCHESGGQMGWTVVFINYYPWITILYMSTSRWTSGLAHDPGLSGDVRKNWISDCNNFGLETSPSSTR